MQAEVTEFLSYRRFHYPLIDSTNIQSKNLILEDGVSTNFIVTANVQTNGKGRSNREWISDEGNLFLSIVPALRDDIKPELYSYISAISVCDVLDDYGVSNYIKWPNDVLVDGKKISGILLEMHKGKLIIGVGLNINSHPEYLDKIDATCLSKNSNKGDKEEVLIDFVKKFNTNSILSLPVIINRVEQKLNKQEFVNSIIGERQVSGKIIGLSSDGNLMLETKSGELEIKSGEIFNL